MPTLVFDEEITLEERLAYEELQRRLAHLRPRRFRRQWRCNRHDCNGQPHAGREFKHARSTQVIPANWTYEEPDPDNPDGEPVVHTTNAVAYIVGGRGSGKTWASCRNFAQLVLETEPDENDDHTEWALIAPIYRTARDVYVEGPSGLIRAFGGYAKRGGLVERWDRTYGHLVLTTGAFIHVDSADEGAVRVQGLNLYGALCGEIGLWKNWKRAWEESIGFAVRKGPARIICDGTPKLSSLAKYLLDDPTVWRTRLRTLDNLANLSKSAVDRLLARFQGTRLGQQELEGLLVDDVEEALWRRATIDLYRVMEHVDEEGRLWWRRSDAWAIEHPDEPVLIRPCTHWSRVAVALDPAGGTEDGDEQGIAVLGQSADDHELYLLESDGFHKTPWDFLSDAVDTALSYKPWPVSFVVEKNYGDQYLVGLLTQVLKAKGVSIGVNYVDASTGKRTRAEGVSGLDERGKVHHVGVFADLEDQQCTWTGLGREPSPDRMDAYVWAAKAFESYSFGPASTNTEVYRWDGTAGLAEQVLADSVPSRRRDEDGALLLPSIQW